MLVKINISSWCEKEKYKKIAFLHCIAYTLTKNTV